MGSENCQYKSWTAAELAKMKTDYYDAMDIESKKIVMASSLHHNLPPDAAVSAQALVAYGDEALSVARAVSEGVEGVIKRFD